MTTDNELRVLASAATPGPWRADIDRDAARVHQVVSTAPLGSPIKVVQHMSSMACCEYIAAASPDRIVALLDRVQQLEAALTEACDRIDYWVKREVTPTPQQLREAAERLRALATGGRK